MEILFAAVVGIALLSAMKFMAIIGLSMRRGKCCVELEICKREAELLEREVFDQSEKIRNRFAETIVKVMNEKIALDAKLMEKTKENEQLTYQLACQLNNPIARFIDCWSPIEQSMVRFCTQVTFGQEGEILKIKAKCPKCETWLESKEMICLTHYHEEHKHSDTTINSFPD